MSFCTVWQFISHLINVGMSPLHLFQLALKLSLSKQIFSLFLNAIISDFYFIWQARNKFYLKMPFCRCTMYFFIKVLPSRRLIPFKMVVCIIRCHICLLCVVLSSIRFLKKHRVLFLFLGSASFWKIESQYWCCCFGKAGWS